jgi:amino acid adenylation domain-containing protein
LRVERFLEDSAATRPAALALICGERRLSYADVDDWSDRVAAGLHRLGVRPRDRVVVHLDNSVETVVAVFGILKAGGVFVVVNPTTKADKLGFILRNCAAAAVVADGRRMSVVSEAMTRAGAACRIIVTGSVPDPMGPAADITFQALAEGPATVPPRGTRGIDVDLCALVYTSGSTGTPKGVMLTHLNVVSAATSITTYLEMASTDVVLNVLPLSFDYGLYQVLMTFKVGGCVVLERSFAYPHAVLETLIAERVTGLPIVPTISAILLGLELDRYDLSSLRYITNTGASLPGRHIAELRRALPHVRIFSMYGLTECKRVSYLPPEEIDRRPDSVGRPMPNVEVYVVDADGRRLTHGTGELVVRGSNVMQGYWELPEETARMLRPGALPGEQDLWTGDVFRIDEDGFLYFVGRRDDIIKTRGEKVSPREVENVLYDLAGVLEAAIVGEPDPVLGQALVAVVVPRAEAGLTENLVLHHCAQRLEDFMVPRRVLFVDSLPRTTTGKIDRRRICLPDESVPAAATPPA